MNTPATGDAVQQAAVALAAAWKERGRSILRAIDIPDDRDDPDYQTELDAAYALTGCLSYCAQEMLDLFPTPPSAQGEV